LKTLLALIVLGILSAGIVAGVAGGLSVSDDIYTVGVSSDSRTMMRYPQMTGLI